MPSFKTTIGVEVTYTVEPAQRGCGTDPSWGAHPDEVTARYNGKDIALTDEDDKLLRIECGAHLEHLIAEAEEVRCAS